MRALSDHAQDNPPSLPYSAARRLWWPSAPPRRWFGVSDSDLALVLPNPANFSQRNLGFMA